jgi:hypothetical protein
LAEARRASATTDRRAAWAFAQGEAAYCPAAWELIQGERRDASGSGRRGLLRQDEVTERQQELQSAQQCRVQNQEHWDEERRERLRGERLEFRVHRVQQPDAWAAGQRQPAERLVQQDAWESGLQAGALIRAARSRAMVSAAAPQQVLARPEPGRERQA